MTDARKPQDPFAGLSGVMTDQKLFDTHRLPEGKPAPEPAQPREKSRHISSDIPRDVSSSKSREKPRELPSRDEIQELSFRLRDELKVKVQAEVPASWQDELEEISRQLDVKKLELYRFILGEFMGKVCWKGDT